MNSQETEEEEKLDNVLQNSGKGCQFTDTKTKNETEEIFVSRLTTAIINCVTLLHKTTAHGAALAYMVDSQNEETYTLSTNRQQ